MQPIPGSSAVRTVTPRNVFFDNPPYTPHFVSGRIDETHAYDGGHTGFEKELREGTITARVTASHLWVPCKRTLANGVGRGATALIVDDARAFKASETISIKGPTDILRVEDDDLAATNGTAVYLHIDELGESDFGHLESVNAGAADAYFELLGGGKVNVEHDVAASTGGVQVYIDEDAANPDERFLAAVPSLKDAFIMTTDGRAIRIKYHATPSTPGVALHFDDNGAVITQRLLFVSPTNADGYVHTDDVIGNQAVVTRSSENAVSAINYLTNTLTVTAATWADGDQVYCDSLAGSEIARGILAERIDLWDDVTRGYVDRYTGKICDQGNLIYDNVLGDIAACLAAADNKLGQLNFYDDGVIV